jgi:predicted house-cleaning noncanonical NTP pyrophosphatase (MazG superfamily)
MLLIMAKSQKIFNKLIRDKIPEIIQHDRGSLAKTRILEDQDYREALKTKVTEEAQELLAANSREEIANELADLEELIRTIALENGISLEELEVIRQKKRLERGGFEKRLWLESIEESSTGGKN